MMSFARPVDDADRAVDVLAAYGEEMRAAVSESQAEMNMMALGLAEREEAALKAHVTRLRSRLPCNRHPNEPSALAAVEGDARRLARRVSDVVAPRVDKLLDAATPRAPGALAVAGIEVRTREAEATLERQKRSIEELRAELERERAADAVLEGRWRQQQRQRAFELAALEEEAHELKESLTRELTEVEGRAAAARDIAGRAEAAVVEQKRHSEQFAAHDAAVAALEGSAAAALATATRLQERAVDRPPSRSPSSSGRTESAGAAERRGSTAGRAAWTLGEVASRVHEMSALEEDRYLVDPSLVLGATVTAPHDSEDGSGAAQRALDFLAVAVEDVADELLVDLAANAHERRAQRRAATDGDTLRTPPLPGVELLHESSRRALAEGAGGAAAGPRSVTPRGRPAPSAAGPSPPPPPPPPPTLAALAEQRAAVLEELREALAEQRGGGRGSAAAAPASIAAEEGTTMQRVANVREEGAVAARAAVRRKIDQLRLETAESIAQLRSPLPAFPPSQT